jgi:hypothetical protein
MVGASGRVQAVVGGDPRKRRRTGRNQDPLQCDETGMKPFSGFHEVMVKPLAIKWTVGNDGPRGAA